MSAECVSQPGLTFLSNSSYTRPFSPVSMISTKMADNIGTMWTRSLDQYVAGLDVHARKRLTSTGSLEALLSDVGVLRAQYAKKTWARIFDRLNPMLQSLNGFNQCVQTFTQVAPKGFILLWGSLSFILEVRRMKVASHQLNVQDRNTNEVFQIAVRYSKGLEQLVEIFEQVELVRPRFETYISRFSPSLHKQLEHTLVLYHIELVGICLDGIKFFKRSPFGKPPPSIAGFIFPTAMSNLVMFGVLSQRQN